MNVRNGPFDKFNLNGRSAVVTGGGTGLGFHIARALASAGAKVVISARREELLREAVDKLNADPFIRDVSYIPVDLGDPKSIDAFADEAIGRLGGVDIFVGNAAELGKGELTAIGVESMTQTVQVNLLSNVQISKRFLPHMQDQRWGRFIFISSINSITGANRNTGIYATTKAGLNALARELAVDFGRYNITANALVIGFWLSTMNIEQARKLRETEGEEAAKNYLDRIGAAIPVGRLGRPEELEGVINLLASDAGSYITGSNLVVDGGKSIMMFPRPVE